MVKSVKLMRTSQGNYAINQFEIVTNSGVYFHSYSITIAAKMNSGVTLLSKKYHISNTTGKYRNLFLGMKRTEIENKIKSNDIILVDEIIIN